MADAFKLFLKEGIIPFVSNKFLFVFAPIITFSLSLLNWLIIPFGFNLVLLDLNIGLLYILMISSLSVYGIIIAGWSSNSRYAFLGSIRSSAQMISYEVSFGIILLSLVIPVSSLNLSELIVFQNESIWFFFPFFINFLMFLIVMLAETNRPPFDLPEAEAELVSGFNVEYSSIGFALFFIGEYSNIIFMSAFVSVLFFGGNFLDLNFFQNVLFYVLFMFSNFFQFYDFHFYYYYLLNNLFFLNVFFNIDFIFFIMDLKFLNFNFFNFNFFIQDFFNKDQIILNYLLEQNDFSLGFLEKLNTDIFFFLKTLNYKLFYLITFLNFTSENHLSSFLDFLQIYLKNLVFENIVNYISFYNKFIFELNLLNKLIDFHLSKTIYFYSNNLLLLSNYLFSSDLSFFEQVYYNELYYEITLSYQKSLHIFFLLKSFLIILTNFNTFIFYFFFSDILVNYLIFLQFLNSYLVNIFFENLINLEFLLFYNFNYLFNLNYSEIIDSLLILNNSYTYLLMYLNNTFFEGLLNNFFLSNISYLYYIELDLIKTYINKNNYFDYLINSSNHYIFKDYLQLFYDFFKLKREFEINFININYFFINFDFIEYDLIKTYFLDVRMYHEFSLNQMYNYNKIDIFNNFNSDLNSNSNSDLNSNSNSDLNSNSNSDLNSNSNI